ncbi:VOC family protein [Streptomyces sp. NPDC048611]|uniref:VOC family protein n=1 Tax=Streptomyces sp. NPDC048611 TaxID=3155635 RepID=UPI0034272513
MSATPAPEPVPAPDGVAVAVQPVIVTPDLDRLQAFYAGLAGAEEITRVPEEGPVFFVMLRVGGSELGIVADRSVATGTPTRILLSIAVQDVDALLDRVGPLGGTVLGPANDMPWGQRVAHIQDPDGNAVNLTQPV